jgi:hypothetical protein
MRSHLIPKCTPDLEAQSHPAPQLQVAAAMAVHHAGPSRAGARFGAAGSAALPSRPARPCAQWFGQDGRPLQ